MLIPHPCDTHSASLSEIESEIPKSRHREPAHNPIQDAETASQSSKLTLQVQEAAQGHEMKYVEAQTELRRSIRYSCNQGLRTYDSSSGHVQRNGCWVICQRIC